MATSVRLADESLDDIQGIVTRGYGWLPEAAYLFVTIADSTGARRWIERVSPLITSSSRSRGDDDSARRQPRAALNLGIAAEGLRACGLPERVLRTFPLEFQDGIASEARSRILGDAGASAPELWEVGGPRTDPVHAVLLLFGKDETVLEEAVEAQRAILKASGSGVVEIPGSLQRGRRPDTSTESFGFRDGIAQPSIAGVHGDGVPTGEFILGYENHYGLIPPTPVVPAELDPGHLLPDLMNPYHAAGNLQDLGRNGTYIVYRKLEQDVVGFWRFVSREAVRLGVDPVWLASKCVGRWPSGAPLALAPDADNPSLGGKDDFFYAGDPDGLACPLGAHVRRVNPRDVLKPYATAQSLSMTEAHRLLRRGRIYGAPLFDPQVLRRAPTDTTRRMLEEMKDDGQSRGVHFLCVNANLKSQFEFVQQNWGNNPRFGGLNDNADPFASRHDDSGETPSRMTIPREGAALRTRPFPRFVTVKAGTYLFIPSLTALRFLGDSRRP